MTRVNNARRLALLAPSLAALICMGAIGKVYADGDDGTATDTVIETHRERQEELVEANNLIQARADGENRDLTEQECADIDGNIAEFDRLEAQINRRVQAAARSAVLTQPKGRKTSPTAARADDEDDGGEAAPAGSRGRVLGRADRIRGDYGFRHPGDFFMAVRNAVTTGHRDERLLAAAASSVATEGAGSDGGFAVPPDFRSNILERINRQDSLLSRTDRQTSSSNSMTFPTDMTTDWQTSGGIQAYWENEASAISQSKPDLQGVTLRLFKLAALVPVTEELLEDAPALGAYVQRKAPAKMDFKISNAIVWGGGVGQPLGFMRSPALVTVAAEGAQTADTINATNIAKMYARMPAEDRANGVWLVNPDAEPQLMLMTIGQTPVYVPPGGMSGNPYGTLLGRPVIPHQVCSTVGDLGDIMFVSFEQYLSLSKTQGVKAQTSIHLWFDQDLVAFKFTYRMGGQPWWSAPIDPLNGTNKMSPFVTLAAR